MAQWSEDITAITQKECEVLLLFYFILLFLFFYSKSSTKRDISFHHKLGVQINIICIHKSNLAQFSVYPIYILECDRWDFPPPPIFNLKLKMLSLCANWKVFIYMKYGGWKNCDEFWRLTLIKNVRWSVVFVNFAQKIMTIPHFQESIVKSDDTLQSFQTNGVHED